MNNTVQYPHTRFIGCQECQVLHPILHDSGRLSGDAQEAAADAFDEFLTAHTAHALIELQRQGSATTSSGPVWDPLARLCFEVSDGQQNLLVTAQRTAIDEPREYRFVSGRLASSAAVVTIEDSNVRRGLDRQFFPHAVRPSKIDSFVGMLREVVSQIDADALEIAFDDAEDPAVSIARFPDESYDEVVTRCFEIFDAAEMSSVSRFLAANRNEDGLLALRVRQDFRVLA